jgi:DNA replication protein DnaC
MLQSFIVQLLLNLVKLYKSSCTVDRWHAVIGDQTYANAIMDRLVHNAHRIELSGESMRRARGKQNHKA